MTPLDILNQTRANLALGSPLDNFLRGRQAANTLQAQELSNEALTQKIAQAAAMNPLQLQAQQQAVQAGQMELDDFQKERALKGVFDLAIEAETIGASNPAKYMREKVGSLGIPGAEELAQDAASMSDEELMAFIPQIKELGRVKGFYGEPKDQPNIQFGGQETFKDEAGNLFFGTTRRNPETGQVESVLAPIDGKSSPVGQVKQAGAYGLTAEEKVGQISAESTAEGRAKINEQARQDYIKQGLTARGMIPKTKKLLELNEAINTGKAAVAKKFMSDIFGVTDPDVGQFNALAGELVLGNIRMLGANPTEGERAFLQQITPSLEQGGAVNKAILEDMLEIQQRQVDRALWFSNNRDKTVEQYLLETDTEDFEPKSSTEDIVQQKTSSIDDLVNKYAD